MYMEDRELTLKILRDIMLHCNSHGIELGKRSDSPLQPVFESASFLFCHLLMKKKTIKIVGPPEPNGLEHSPSLG